MLPERVSDTPGIPGGRLHHPYAGAAALLASILAHLAVLSNFPALPVGRPADFAALRRFRTVELGEVRLRPSRPASRPAAFRAEDPRRMAAVPSAEEMETALRETWRFQPDLKTTPLAGEEQPLARPATPESAYWEARAEVLQIQEKLLADEVSALPRWYLADVRREKTARDVVWPAEQPVLATGPATSVSAEGKEIRPAALPAGGSGLAGAGVEPTTESAESRREASRLLDEDRSEITGIEPIEELLSLEVQTYRPPDENVLYFAVQIRRRSESFLPVLPKDVLLIQDCSESMTQRKLENCKEGLHRWLDRLGPEDRFNIMGFREDPYLCFDRWEPVTAAARARARGFIEQMVSRGKTDVYGSLQQLLGVARDPARPVIAVLVSDGRPTTGVVDSSEIIEAFTGENAATRSVFCVGAGQRVNRFLLDLLSYKNRGDCLIVTDRGELPGAMDEWAGQLSRPVLTDLEYRFSGPANLEVYPRTLTHLYLDRPLTVYGRCPAEEPVAFRILGTSGARPHDMVFRLDWSEATAGRGEIRTQWAWQKIYDLIGQHLRTGSPAVLREIQDVAARYGLRVPYASDTPLR